jgi:glycosyltransferase involved in cell wall biosynthesis
VASVLAQTYRPIEIIVVDDGSTDNTPATCRELLERHRDVVRVVHQRNGGPGTARESGRLLARGEFIQYLDSDDLLHPEKFGRQVAALRAHPECGVAYCYTRCYRIGDRPSDQPWKRTGETLETMFPSFLTERWWETGTPLYRRTICDAVGAWLNLSLEEDWEYDCRVAALGTRLVHCRDFFVDHRDHGGDRLSRGRALDATRNRDRARAQALIFLHARRAGISTSDPHMRRFARSLFLLARQCGASGLPQEAGRLFNLAIEASGPERAGGLDFRLYRAAAACFGWTTVGHLSCLVDRVRFANPS